MKTVMLLGSSLHVGGAERVMESLATSVDRSRFCLAVCHLKERGSIGDEMLVRGTRVIGVPAARSRLAKYFSFVRLARVVRACQAQLIHTHTMYALTDAVLCKWLLCRGVRVVHTFHFGNYPDYPRRYRYLEFVGCRLADRLVAVGVEQCKRIRAMYRLSESRIATVANGVDAASGTVDPEWCVRLKQNEQLVIGTICTFIEQKGLPDFLVIASNLCREFENVVFVLVGGGPLRESLARQCSQLGIEERVHFVGWRPDARSAMLPLFDIFVQTSKWEAMSIAVLEAMAAAKPVVVTDVGDNRHVVEDGVTGFVVPAGDISGLQAAVAQLASSPEKRLAFGLAAQRRHAERYTVERMTQNYETLYSSCLEDIAAK